MFSYCRGCRGTGNGCADSSLEVRTPCCRRQDKHKEDHFINFYLVAESGEELLAATGEDHGNAHYLYISTPALRKYGEFNSNNRRDLITW